MKKWTSFLLALAAVLITVALVWYVRRPLAPKQATWDDVLAEAEAGGYRIISTEDLADRYRKETTGLMLVDTRQEWEYRTGHIEGAVNFPMEPTWWARWRKANELKDFLGPDQDRALVFY
ncbi:MAG: rhodanese-like domain-containing protein [Deltaproteobacteria bacterium]|nr:rhodanese-like domain-containing protein [Deltaproteobacteria bacterium]